MISAHFGQEEKAPIPALVIDRSPELVRLVETEELPAYVGAVLVGWGRCRTLGAACRLGRQELRRLPGLGRKGLAALETLAAAHGIEVLP